MPTSALRWLELSTVVHVPDTGPFLGSLQEVMGFPDERLAKWATWTPPSLS